MSQSEICSFRLSACICLLFCLSESVIRSSAEICPYGWNEFRGRCYLVDIIGIHSLRSAEDYCRSFDGVLASVADNETYNFLNELITNVRSASGYYSFHSHIVSCNTKFNDTCLTISCCNLWVGLYSDKRTCDDCPPGSSQLREGWKWRDGSRYDPQQVKWAPGEPKRFSRFIKLGVVDTSFKLHLVENSKYASEDAGGYICSKVLQTQQTQPTPWSSTTETTLDNNKYFSSFYNGIGMGLGNGVVLMVCIGVAAIIMLKNCKRSARVYERYTKPSPTTVTSESTYAELFVPKTSPSAAEASAV